MAVSHVCYLSPLLPSPSKFLVPPKIPALPATQSHHYRSCSEEEEKESPDFIQYGGCGSEAHSGGGEWFQWPRSFFLPPPSPSLSSLLFHHIREQIDKKGNYKNSKDTNRRTDQLINAATV